METGMNTLTLQRNYKTYNYEYDITVTYTVPEKTKATKNSSF